MGKQLLVWILICVFAILTTGCASRAPLVDDAGQAISREEFKARKSNSNLLLYALGGGALSFGASFFAGSLIDRASDSESNSALWLTTGIGAAVGMAYFGHQGSARDHNLAVDLIRDERNAGVTSQIVDERTRRSTINNEKKQLMEARKKQEAERRALLERLRQKKDEKSKKTENEQR